MGPKVRAHQECRFSTTVSAQVNSTCVFGAAVANIAEFAKNVKTTAGLPLKLSEFEDSPPWAKVSLLVN
jgi:hypothetical protein